MEKTKLDVTDEQPMVTMATTESLATGNAEDFDEVVISFNEGEDVSMATNLSNQMIFLINSLSPDSTEGFRLLSQLNLFPVNTVSDIHAMAKANLISQTQEAIMQEYNICDSDFTAGNSNEHLRASDINIVTDGLKLNSSSPDKNSETKFTKEGKNILESNITISNVSNIVNENKQLNSSQLDCTSSTEINIGTRNETETGEHILISNSITELVKADEHLANKTTKTTGEVEVVQTADGHTEMYEQTPEKESILEDTGTGMSDVMKRQFDDIEQLQDDAVCHRPLVCPETGCGRTFTYPSHFTYHLLTHKSDKRYACESCGKLFYTSQQLHVHQRLHSGSKPFACTACGKAFTTAGNLKNHKRLHTGERPYVCDEDGCNKCFAEISSLKKHKLTHTGEKPFQCDICNKTFSQTSSRNYHMKRHLPEGDNSSHS